MRRLSRYTRLHLVASTFTGIFLLLAIRLVFVQLLRHSYMQELAGRQYDLVLKLPAIRGSIYDINKKELAVSINTDSIYANPHLINNPEEAAKQLAPILGPDKDFLYSKFTKDKAFVWLARRVPERTSDNCKQLNLKYIGFVKEPKRVYPAGSLACHIIGFTGLDDVGLEGIELSYDKYLRGRSGIRFTKQDAKSRQLPAYKNRTIPPQDGYDIVLTIDAFIQSLAEAELEEVIKKFDAKSATAIVMEPATGRVLALANRPAFHPNNFQDSRPDVRRNRAITDIFEPGSAFKIVTATAALENKGVNIKDKFYCENGSFRALSSYTLHDYHPYGWLTFREVFEKSSNIGTGKIAQIVGSGRLYKTIKAYGFGSKTGIDLDGEISGIIREPSLWSKTSFWNIPMGQEVAVTALQLACAISSVANDGMLMRPYAVDRIQDKKGVAIKSFSPQLLRQVADEDTVRQLKEILAGVVENGTGKNARIKGIRVAGKTGTAQKVNPEGGYSKNNFVSSFIGFAPVDKPKVSCVVIADQPRRQHFGSIVSAPAFARIVSQTLDYLETKSMSEVSAEQTEVGL